MFAAAALGFGQTSAVLPTREAFGLYTRSNQLMEAASFAIPELARAGAPVIENAKQTFSTMRKVGNANHSGFTFTYLSNLHAFLALYDAVPKPFPFPDEARRQVQELRDAATRLEAHFRALLEAKETQVRGPDRDNLKRYSEANSRLSAPAAGKPRVVFLGDSITDFWRLNEYFPDRDFVNRGISGQITGEMLGRMKADVIDLKPAAVLILAGTNDIARGVPLTTIQNNLLMIADLAALYKIKPIFASVLPVSDYHVGDDPSYERTSARPLAVIKNLNTWIQRLCKDRNYTYLNYWDAVVDQAGQLRSEIAEDGLHPNAAGYRLMAPVALAAIDKTVPPAAAAPAATTRRK